MRWSELLEELNPTKRPATLGHRLILVECMLGTVYAVSPEREARYFGYDYEGALAFCQPGIDVRWSKPRESAWYVKSGAMEASPRQNQMALWSL